MGDENIGGLDVAVDQAQYVHVFQRLTAFENGIDHCFVIEQGAETAMLFHRAAVDALHHHIVVNAIGHDIVNLDDVRVIDFAEQCRFSTQPQIGEVITGGFTFLRGLLDDLDRDFAVVKRIRRQIDGTGRTPAQHAQQGVFAEIARQGMIIVIKGRWAGHDSR